MRGLVCAAVCSPNQHPSHQPNLGRWSYRTLACPGRWRLSVQPTAPGSVFCGRPSSAGVTHSILRRPPRPRWCPTRRQTSRPRGCKAAWPSCLIRPRRCQNRSPYPPAPGPVTSGLDAERTAPSGNRKKAWTLLLDSTQSKTAPSGTTARKAGGWVSGQIMPQLRPDCSPDCGSLTSRGTRADDRVPVLERVRYSLVNQITVEFRIPRRCILQ